MTGGGVTPPPASRREEPVEAAAMTGEVGNPADPPLRKVAAVPVDWLVLDRQTPRLVGRSGAGDDVSIIARLYRGESLDELLESIAANGYLDIEPLIVLGKDGRLVVLEGNRRLAAVRLFREPGLAERVSERGRVRVTLPEICERRRGALDRVPVYRVATRGDSRAFIGFKHINGAAKWDSYAKARFAAKWYSDGDATLAEIAGCVGDRHGAVKRMVNAIYVLDRALDAKVFDIADRAIPRFNFSHFYTALSRVEYMEFLGLDPSWSNCAAALTDPIPADRLDRLGEVLRWLYGSRSEGIRPIVLFQNPHVKQLGEVLASREGLTVLRATGSLSDAYASAGPADRRFREAMLRARREIRTAMGGLRGFDDRDESMIDIAEDVLEAARAIHGGMKKKMRDTAMNGERSPLGSG